MAHSGIYRLKLNKDAMKMGKKQKKNMGKSGKYNK